MVSITDYLYTYTSYNIIKIRPYHTIEYNNISFHPLVGISNGQVIFNVSDELTEDMYEVVDAEDPVVEAGRVKYAIQTFASVSLWIPKKILHRYWKRRHVIILPHWAFNKLILGNWVQIWDTVYIHFYIMEYSLVSINLIILFCFAASNPSLRDILQNGPTDCLSPTKDT